MCEYGPELLFNPREKSGNFQGPAAVVREMVGLGAPHKTVLVGGSVQFPGFINRYISDVGEATGLSTTDHAVLAPSQLQRPHASWTGGSILGSMAGINNLWITSFDYQENGIDRLIKKIA